MSKTICGNLITSFIAKKIDKTKVEIISCTTTSIANATTLRLKLAYSIPNYSNP